MEVADNFSIESLPENKPRSLLGHAWSSMKRDKYAMTALGIVGVYFLVAILGMLGFVASGWGEEVGASYATPSLDHIFGLDIFGRSVFAKTVKGVQVAITVGLISGLMSIMIGLVLGAVAGYFGGWVDDLIVWFYTSFSSIPYIMLLLSVAFILGKGIESVCIALGATTWVSTCRLIRGEVIKHKSREYVHAASALGGGHVRKLFRHIIPNVSHILIINFSLQFQVAIKSEVILSYLGLGVQDLPSWGRMIDDAKLELARGVWWQLAAATLAMMIVVLAFNILSDALRDALDPKLKGK